MKLDRGRVALVTLDPATGHEQGGQRPCVVVSDPEVSGHQRYPIVCVVPVTGTPGSGALYPTLAPGRSGFRKPSTALVDQVRTVDKGRLRVVFGRISDAELRAIDEGLALFLGLELTPPQEGKVGD